jgi:predicted nucleic acid-binding protein
LTGWVILDTDFLSAFQKIGRLSLVGEFFGAQGVVIPPAVYGEISETQLLPSRMPSEIRLDLVAPDGSTLTSLRENTAFALLGPGEQEAIALAISAPGSVLLMNDNQARRVAKAAGVAVFNIPAFLLAAKETRFLDLPALTSIVKDLQEKDHYGFKEEVLLALLS